MKVICCESNLMIFASSSTVSDSRYMRELLSKLHYKSRTQAWVYPIYLMVRLPSTFFALVQNEGFSGALGWLSRRAKFARANKDSINESDIFQKPIEPFESRHGFTLSCYIEYIIYDELFLERVYAFKNLENTLRSSKDITVLDFGTHHGMFINYVQSLQPSAKVFGAELNPKTFAQLSKRFIGARGVTLLNAGIGGHAREVKLSLTPISTQQSIYSEGEKSVSSQIITPVDFINRYGLDKQRITLLKMDIEGAEDEVFDNLACIKSLLERTDSIVIEIHDEKRVPFLTDTLKGLGFDFIEKRVINFFYAKPGFLKSN